MTSGYDAAILEERAVVGDLAGRRDSHPFLDPRLIAATYGLDPWWPSRGDHTRAFQVAAYADRLPPAVAERRSKADFSEVFWPQLLREELLARVRTGPLAEAGWLDPAGFESLVVNAQREMANAAIPLSRCVSLDRWLRTR
jgi:Asparagine synthase